MLCSLKMCWYCGYKTDFSKVGQYCRPGNGRYAGPEVGSRSIPAILYEDLYRQHGCCNGADFRSSEGRTKGIALLDFTSNVRFVEFSDLLHPSECLANRGQSLCVTLTELVSASVVSYLAMIAIGSLLVPELGWYTSS